jgi:hypothetical protein
VRRLAERVRRSGSALLVELIAVARRAAAEAAAVTPNAAGWLALAEAEYERARGVARPERWSDAAAAWALVISVRTAGVHVSHVLRKLGAPNRLEAAAIAHRLSPPHAGQPAFERLTAFWATPQQSAVSVPWRDGVSRVGGGCGARLPGRPGR